MSVSWKQIPGAIRSEDAVKTQHHADVINKTASQAVFG